MRSKFSSSYALFHNIDLLGCQVVKFVPEIWTEAWRIINRPSGAPVIIPKAQEKPLTTCEKTTM